MRQISSEEVTEGLRGLFDKNEPASLRCFAVLEGNAAGRILTDNPANPSWGIVQETFERSIYLGGKLDAALLGEIINTLRREGDVLIGLRNDDARWSMVPPEPDYQGTVLEFFNRSVGGGSDAFFKAVPPGCELRRIDRELFERCAERDVTVAIYGSTEEALAKGFGLCLMRGETILCDAFAGPAALSMIELGVTTLERYRERGYATITCAHLVRWCEQLGYATYWNCAKQNKASAAVARKLGYQVEKEYRLWAWY